VTIRDFGLYRTMAWRPYSGVERVTLGCRGGVEMSLIDQQPPDMDGTQPVDSRGLARQRAIRQIEPRRHIHIELVVGALGTILLVVIWATSAYHNAGGWPTHGFSQSSDIHDAWNFWIIYPLIAWGLYITARAPGRCTGTSRSPRARSRARCSVRPAGSGEADTSGAVPGAAGGTVRRLGRVV
jgi:hypothetical protein